MVSGCGICQCLCVAALESDSFGGMWNGSEPGGAVEQFKADPSVSLTSFLPPLTGTGGAIAPSRGSACFHYSSLVPALGLLLGIQMLYLGRVVASYWSLHQLRYTILHRPCHSGQNRRRFQAVLEQLIKHPWQLGTLLLVALRIYAITTILHCDRSHFHERRTRSCFIRAVD